MRLDEIDRHIQVLNDFEREYRMYVHALEEEQRTGHPFWHSQAHAEKRADILRRAPRAAQAIEASGVHARLNPPPFAGGPPLTDFVSQVFAHETPPYSTAPNALEAPRLVLDNVVAAVGALEIEREAAAASSGSARRDSRRPTIFGHIRRIPDGLALLADIGGSLAVIAWLLKVFGIL